MIDSMKYPWSPMMSLIHQAWNYREISDEYIAEVFISRISFSCIHFQFAIR